MDQLIGWYMLRRDGADVTAFQAESDAEADSKVQTLRDVCRTPHGVFTWIPMVQAIEENAR